LLRLYFFASQQQARRRSLLNLHANVETTTAEGSSRERLSSEGLTNRWSQSLTAPMTGSQHVYKVRPREDHRGVDLISNALPFGRLWYSGPDAVGNAIGYAKFRSRSNNAVIRVYDDAGNIIETRERAGDFREAC
jgi:hypothetical protein